MSPRHRQRLLALTAAAALVAVPAAGALAQGSAGTSRMPQTTQTTPQEGPLGGSPGARAGANAGHVAGMVGASWISGTRCCAGLERE